MATNPPSSDTPFEIPDRALATLSELMEKGKPAREKGSRCLRKRYGEKIAVLRVLWCLADVRC